MNRHHSDLLAAMASIYNPKVYVELGLAEGETFKKILPHVSQKAYGVDLRSNNYLVDIQNKHRNKVDFHFESTDTFFNNFSNDEKIDMAFIDADHNYVTALRDFDNILSRLSDNGVIFLHDTDPIDEQHIDEKTYFWCGDCFKLVNILEQRNDINVITMPLTEAGLTMVMKKNSSRTFLRRNK